MCWIFLKNVYYTVHYAQHSLASIALKHYFPFYSIFSCSGACEPVRFCPFRDIFYIGATLRTCWGIHCLPYVEFLFQWNYAIMHENCFVRFRWIGLKCVLWEVRYLSKLYRGLSQPGRVFSTKILSDRWFIMDKRFFGLLTADQATCLWCEPFSNQGQEMSTLIE